MSKKSYSGNSGTRCTTERNGKKNIRNMKKMVYNCKKELRNCSSLTNGTSCIFSFLGQYSK